MKFGKTLINLAAVATLAATTIATPVLAAERKAPKREQCHQGTWPAEADGRPVGLKAAAPAGLYVWHDADGWNAAVTHENKERMVFRGTIKASGKIESVERRTERADRSKVNHHHNTVSFEFNNFGGVDGLVFKTACSRKITFSGSINGKRLTADQVFIGAEGHHPDKVPFSIVRVKDGPVPTTTTIAPVAAPAS